MLDFTVTTDEEGSLHLGPRSSRSRNRSARAPGVSSPIPSPTSPSPTSATRLPGGRWSSRQTGKPCPHGGFGGIFGAPTPEDQEMSETFVRFVDKYLG